MQKLLIIILFGLLGNYSFSQEKTNVYFEIRAKSDRNPKSIPDSIRIAFFSMDYKPGFPERKVIAKPSGNAVWRLETTGLIEATVDALKANNKANFWYMEPGDSVVMFYDDGNLTFVGKGAEKYNLQNDIVGIRQGVPKPKNPSLFTLHSLQDYLEWDEYLDKQWAVLEPLFDRYKDKVSSHALAIIKVKTISDLQYEREHKFLRLPRDREKFNIKPDLLVKLFDRDFLTPEAIWMRSQPFPIVGSIKDKNFPSYLVYRERNFISINKPTEDTITKYELKIYETAKKIYKGRALEEFYRNYLTFQIDKVGLTSSILELLKRYYNDDERDPLYKNVIRLVENDERNLKINRGIPNFTAVDKSGTIYQKNSLNEKTVVVHFFDAHNRASVKMERELAQIKRDFGNDSYIEILLLPIKKQSDNILKTFNIKRLPAVFVIGLNGRLITSSYRDSNLTSEKVSKIITQQREVAIKEKWQETNDGPYILTSENRDTLIYQIKDSNLLAFKPNERQLSVPTDVPGEYFSVKLHDYSVEPSIFDKPEKLIIFSDIEGNFDALRQLLQANNVIDKSFNWTFGKGHIVFAGDMFDRGEQVTECLWLMYDLENKAKAAGGYVHFILGNHELMNFENDHRYVRSKYSKTANKLGKPLSDLYGPNSELGKWLRSKNVIEKIGDLLVVHAGISPEVNRMGLSPKQINELIRPFYGRRPDAIDDRDERIALLFGTSTSPFWYRNYYLESETVTKIGGNQLRVHFKTSKAVVDSVLETFGVERIVTGHTIFEGVPNEERGKYITIHYDGKVINADTHHAKGFSEAILIENGKYYAVNRAGGRRPLFKMSTKNDVVRE